MGWPFIALGAAGVAWALHLAASYFLVAIGCPRDWPGLGWLLALATLACAMAAAASGVLAYTT
ncbi:MAG: hypothetical protein ACREJG_01520, partial [Candidatus Rokuibacteriota bacterium]